MDIFIKQLAHCAQANAVPVEYVLSRFDNPSGQLNREDIRKTCNQLDIQLREIQLTDIMDYFTNGEKDTIPLIEFKALLKPEIQKLVETSVREFTPQEKKEIFRSIAKFIFDYLRKNNMTIQQFARKMDDRLDGYISSEDFGLFFRRLGIIVENKEVHAFFNELDPAEKGKIAINDFIKLITPYLKERPLITKNIQDSLYNLADYIKRNKLDTYTFFTQLDSDKSGFLDRDEIRAAVIATGAVPSQIELTNLLNFFDYGEDGKISVKEFVETLEPYVKRIATQTTTHTLEPSKLQQFRKKCVAIIQENKENLAGGFDILKIKDGLITKEDFKKVLVGLNIGFTPSEIEIILDNLVVMEDVFINYNKFLDLKETDPIPRPSSSTPLTLPQRNKDKPFEKPYESTPMTESQYYGSADSTLKRSMTAETLFRKMNKILKETNISARAAFEILDKNGDGLISIQEFR